MRRGVQNLLFEPPIRLLIQMMFPTARLAAMHSGGPHRCGGRRENFKGQVVKLGFRIRRGAMLGLLAG